MRKITFVGFVGFEFCGIFLDGVLLLLFLGGVGVGAHCEWC